VNLVGRVWSRVIDALRRWEHPSVFLINVAMQSEIYTLSLHDALPISFTQGAIAVVGVVCRDDHQHALEGLERAARATPAQLDVELGAAHASSAVGLEEGLARPAGSEEAIGSERTRARRHVRPSLLPRL